jgi:hypothetical protein
MVFTNMFAIFYLETICMTKKTAKKQSEDKFIGHVINGFVTIFYVCIFILLLLLGMHKYGDNFSSGNGLGQSQYTLLADTAPLN